MGNDFFHDRNEDQKAQAKVTGCIRDWEISEVVALLFELKDLSTCCDLSRDTCGQWRKLAMLQGGADNWFSKTVLCRLR